MPSEGQVYFELLPIEINAPHFKRVFASQLKKGISLSQVIPAIEKDSLQKIRKSVADLLIKKHASKILKKEIKEIESEYIKVRRAINEVLKWLEYLVLTRKKIQSIEILPENENESIHKIETELFELLKKLDPALRAIVKKREEENRNIGRILKETIDHMEKETFVRTKKIVLKYEKMGKEKYDLIQSSFDRFFDNFRAHLDKILSFIQPKLSEWNAMVLSSGRGFLIDSVPHLPCSILFSVKGQCHLIFETVGHLLGSGVDKRVLRSISLPQGKIQALIKPLLIQETPESTATPELQLANKEKQFYDMWMETEILMRLKHKKGIVDLDERMAFEIEGEKKLYLAEDYFWDGTVWDYLKYPLHCGIDSARLSPKKQRKIISDLLKGLVEIHKLHIVHHDIKPDNILLDLRKGGAKAVIADFHQATYIKDKERIKELKFIPKWAPPEYAKIHLHPDRPMEEIANDYFAITSGKLDVWSMGLVFYSLIAYELPFWVKKEIDENISLDEMELYRIQAGLKKGWLPDLLKSSPYFPLLEKMLEPEQADRCTALEALQILKKCAL